MVSKSLHKHISRFYKFHHTVHNKCQRNPPSTVLHVAQETEDAEEEVDEIKIETNRPQDVLVWGEAAVDEVRVIDDVSAEQQSPTNGVNETESGAERDECADETCHDCQILRRGFTVWDSTGPYPKQEGHRIAMVPFQRNHTLNARH